MDILQSSIYAMGISFCLFSCLFFSLNKTSSAHLNITSAANNADFSCKPNIKLQFFLIYLLLEASGFIFEWLLMHPSTSVKALWLGLLMCSSFFVAPCLWLFAKEISENKTTKLKSLAKGHFVVIGLGILFTLPLLSTLIPSSPFSKSEGLSLSADLKFIIHASMVASIAIFSLQVPYYLKRCLAIIKTSGEQNRTLFSNLDDKQFNTVRILIWVVLTNWLVSLVRSLYCMSGGSGNGEGIVFALLEVIVTAYALISVIKENPVLDAADKTLVDSLFVASPDDGLSEGEAKYQKSSVDQALAKRIQDKLEHCLTEQKLFQNNNLNLRSLSQNIGEKPHYVSQVINQYLSSSFYELINTYRIKHALDLIKTKPELNLLNIAYEVGFNSKSTFNNNFRRIQGITSSQYKNQCLASAA